MRRTSKANVRPLAAPVGVQLIEHQVLQVLAVADDLLISGVLPRHQVFQHHEVGQQDIGGLAETLRRSSLPSWPA